MCIYIYIYTHIYVYTIMSHIKANPHVIQAEELHDQQELGADFLQRIYE